MDDTQSGFIRQRRNLMVMSLVVLFAEIADLKIEKLSIFGSEATFGNPQTVKTALWILLIYWLVRYYQYFHDLGDTGLVGAIKAKRRQIVGARAFRRYFRDPSFTNMLVAQDGRTLYAYQRDHHVFRDFWFKVTGSLEFFITSDPEQEVGTHESTEFSFTGWQLVAPTLLSAAHVFVRTKYFSEYILPFVLFALPWCFTNPSAKSWLVSQLAG